MTVARRKIRHDLTISFGDEEYQMLQRLYRTGFYGADVAETAEQLARERLQQIEALAVRLRHAVTARERRAAGQAPGNPGQDPCQRAGRNRV
jgi:hypothetical protein